MPRLFDTGVLLRLFDRSDPNFSAIRDCMQRLRHEQYGICVTVQNLTEFWNVTTRPATARGGYGKPIAIAEKRMRFLESICSVLYPSPHSLHEWRQLVVTLHVHGVQVHDAHLVAVMRASGVEEVITLNTADFARYPGIIAMTPGELLANLSHASDSGR